MTTNPARTAHDKHVLSAVGWAGAAGQLGLAWALSAAARRAARSRRT